MRQVTSMMCFLFLICGDDADGHVHCTCVHVISSELPSDAPEYKRGEQHCFLLFLHVALSYCRRGPTRPAIVYRTVLSYSKLVLLYIY